MDMENKSSKKSTSIIKSSLILLASLFLAFCIFTGIRAYQFKNYTQASPLSSTEKTALQNLLRAEYPGQYEILKALPYTFSATEPDIWAQSAILIDTANGNILYEKNADQIIPPASMTKLFAMYVVEEEVAAGRLSYDQQISLPPECWACNMPPHSSLMFLGEGQSVTLEELLLGLSICSGNDAAYALAYAVCGNMDDFVARMNQIADDLGLKNTHFVESSGYSEKNTTTAREMACFCRIYIQNHPDSLARFHSVQSFTYPKEKNLAPGDILQAQDFSQGLPRHITMPITQQNTNPLLGKLDGADGLKTGYIDESGYNLSLTASRFGTRFLSVTMAGPGSNSREGQAGRVHDGTELMEWAFRNFRDFLIEDFLGPYFMQTFGASQMGINLIPAYDDDVLTVPYISGDSVDDNLANIQVSVEIYDDRWGEIQVGQKCGRIRFSLQGYLLEEIPLIADRSLEKGNWMVRLSDKVIMGGVTTGVTKGS